ncbi:hypothetical protein ACH5RR_005817 [Cinchona calisaya]|uniref:CCR4-NOT transcription complex subunit 10 n=1 Tax=Cinchona calisaya TaxID=153742 RepID=A0ABD3AMI0_9GENT
MDSSSTSSSPAIVVGDNNNNNNSNNRGGALSPIAASPRRSMEDDAALSVAAELAKEAALLFQAGKFVECINVLNQLLNKKMGDPKILHNIAITEYFQEGCSDPKKLLEVLNSVKKRSEELAHASEEQQTESGGNTSKLAVGSKGNNNVAISISATGSLPVVYTDVFDTSVTMHNMAVIWFHLHEYARSFSILDALYQNIEPIDEGTALHICLLLLDVALVSNHASRSADVISYVEKVFCVNNLTNQVDNGNSLHQPSMVSKSASLSATVPDASNSDSASANALEISLSRTLSEEALEDESLQLLSSLDISGGVPRPSSLHSSNDLSRNQTDDSVSTIDLRLKLHLYKVRFLLLTRNLKTAKREVKMAMNIAHGKDYTVALYLKSQLEYARGNHSKAIKLLMASSNRTEMGISSIYYNNLGCIYYCLGKYHTSAVFFEKALRNSSALRKEKPLKLVTLSQDKSLHIIYNCGLQYLACGKPLPAARCFYQAGLIFYNRPLLWLRIAECCLMALEKGLLKSSYSAPSDGSEVKVHVIGKGKWRQLSLEDGVSRIGKLNFVGREDFSCSNDRQPNLSISLARQCLLNALHLVENSDSKNLKSGLVSNSAAEGSGSGELSSNCTNYKNVVVGDSKSLNAALGSSPVNTNGEVKEQKGGNGQNTSLLNSIYGYEDDICRKENQMIKQALLADLAFVELELGNPLKALSIARSLLELFECSRIYVFLGNVYAAEALCLLNRPKEAAEHLFIYVAGGDNVELPYSQDDFEKWRVEKIVDCEETNGGPVAVNAPSPDESQGFVFLKPVEARGTLFANLAAVYAMQGELEQAQQMVMEAFSVIPNSPQVILTAIYLDLLRGRTQDALAKLKQWNRIRFLPSSFALDGSS